MKRRVAVATSQRKHLSRSATRRVTRYYAVGVHYSLSRLSYRYRRGRSMPTRLKRRRAAGSSIHATPIYIRFPFVGFANGRPIFAVRIRRESLSGLDERTRRLTLSIGERDVAFRPGSDRSSARERIANFPSARDPLSRRELVRRAGSTRQKVNGNCHTGRR